MQHFIDKIRQALRQKTVEALEQFDQVRQSIEQAFADAERLAREQFAQAERDLEVVALAAAAKYQDSLDSLRDDACGRAAGVALDVAEQIVASDPRQQKPMQPAEPAETEPTPEPRRTASPVAAQNVETGRAGFVPEPAPEPTGGGGRKHAGNGRVGRT